MIIPGIFEKDFSEVKKKVELIHKSAPLIQIDMADGKLVDGQTFRDITLVESLETNAEIELDLMETHPLNFLKRKLKNVSKIIIHVESSDDLLEEILKAKNYDYKVGFGISPDTEIEKLDPYVEYLDYVQFMTIIPGGQGRPFRPDVVDTIKQFKTTYPNMKTQADGGMNVDTVPKIIEAGIDSIIVGSSIFNTESPIEAFETLTKLEESLR